MDLYVDLPIPFATACLGGTVRVPTIDDAFDYSIPEGTQTGTTFTIRGKGLKTRNGTGNLYLNVFVEVPTRLFVEVPTRLTREQKRKVEEAGASCDVRQYDKAKKYSDDMSALYGTDAYKN